MATFTVVPYCQQITEHSPVTPNCDFTATFDDFKFGLVAGGRCVVAFSRGLAVTPKHRSQQIAVFALLEMPITRLSRLCWDCTASILRLYNELRRTTATDRSAVVAWSYDYRTSSETVHRACSDHCEPRQTLLRPLYDLSSSLLRPAVIGRDCL